MAAQDGCFNKSDLEGIRGNLQVRLDRMEQDHRTKIAELRGRLKQINDMLMELHIGGVGEDTTDLPPNDTDTFKE